MRECRKTTGILAFLRRTAKGILYYKLCLAVLPQDLRSTTGILAFLRRTAKGILYYKLCLAVLPQDLRSTIDILTIRSHRKGDKDTKKIGTLLCVLCPFVVKMTAIILIMKRSWPKLV